MFYSSTLTHHTYSNLDVSHHQRLSTHRAVSFLNKQVPVEIRSTEYARAVHAPILESQRRNAIQLLHDIYRLYTKHVILTLPATRVVLLFRRTRRMLNQIGILFGSRFVLERRPSDNTNNYQ